mmetsp:Transcript_32776/g.77704  ORF Transcript_32776/g.77704 Transcript_32776/m.77704 type:complete len:241 (-) Transcript_32776:1324-2046(-)
MGRAVRRLLRGWEPEEQHVLPVRGPASGLGDPRRAPGSDLPGDNKQPALLLVHGNDARGADLPPQRRRAAPRPTRGRMAGDLRPVEDALQADAGADGAPPSEQRHVHVDAPPGPRRGGRGVGPRPAPRAQIRDTDWRGPHRRRRRLCQAGPQRDGQAPNRERLRPHFRRQGRSAAAPRGQDRRPPLVHLGPLLHRRGGGGGRGAPPAAAPAAAAPDPAPGRSCSRAGPAGRSGSGTSRGS